MNQNTVNNKNGYLYISWGCVDRVVFIYQLRVCRLCSFKYSAFNICRSSYPICDGLVDWLTENRNLHKSQSCCRSLNQTQKPWIMLIQPCIYVMHIHKTWWMAWIPAEWVMIATRSRCCDTRTFCYKTAQYWLSFSSPAGPWVTIHQQGIDHRQIDNCMYRSLPPKGANWPV